MNIDEFAKNLFIFILCSRNVNQFTEIQPYLKHPIKVSKLARYGITELINSFCKTFDQAIKTFAALWVQTLEYKLWLKAQESLFILKKSV